MTPPQFSEALGKPAPTCANCGAPLDTVKKHDSRLIVSPAEEQLVEEENSVAQRQDFCARCQAEARAGEYHGRWLAQRPAPPPPPKRETRKARAARLREEYHRLTDQPEPSAEDLDDIYLIAHLLMKTGGFKWLETDEEAGVIHFEDQSTKSRCEVRSVELDRERLNQAQERISGLL